MADSLELRLLPDWLRRVIPYSWLSSLTLLRYRYDSWWFRKVYLLCCLHLKICRGFGCSRRIDFDMILLVVPQCALSAADFELITVHFYIHFMSYFHVACIFSYADKASPFKFLKATWSLNNLYFLKINFSFLFICFAV